MKLIPPNITPGPYTQDPEGEYATAIEGADGAVVGTVLHEADAIAYAALPDVLDALSAMFAANQRMVGLADEDPPPFLSEAGKEVHGACKQARAALLKAGYTLEQ